MKKLFTQLAIGLLLPMALWAQSQGPVSLEGRWAEGENRAVFRRAGLTFVGNGSLLQVFETVQSVSGNLYRPRSGAVLLMEDVIEDIWVRSDAQYVYVACGKAGVAIVEFNPLTKSFGNVVSRYNTPGEATGVAHWAGSNYLYIADGSGGVRILYIGIPNDPQPKGVYETASPAREVWMHDANTLLVAADEAGLYSIDVTDKDSPQMLDNLALFEIFNGYGSRAWSVIADDTTAFVASGMGGMSIVNIKDMANLQERARWTYRGTPTDMRSVWTSGNFAHVACADAGLLTHIDITDLGHPTGPLFPRLDTKGAATDLVVAGDTAYVASGVSGHWRVLVAANAPAAGLNRAPMADQAYDAVISGNYTYVAAGRAGIQVVDLLSASGTDQLLSVAARLDTVGEARAVTKRLSKLYVANGSQGLSILDVTTPTAPQISSLSVAAGDTCYDVEVPPGYYAYLAGGQGGMRVVDIGQSPVAEVGLGRVFTPAPCRGVFVEDTKAYLAATSHVYIYDIGGLSTNTVPSMLQSLDYPAWTPETWWFKGIPWWWPTASTGFCSGTPPPMWSIPCRWGALSPTSRSRGAPFTRPMGNGASAFSISPVQKHTPRAPHTTPMTGPGAWMWWTTGCWWQTVGVGCTCWTPRSSQALRSRRPTSISVPLPMARAVPASSPSVMKGPPC